VSETAIGLDVVYSPDDSGYYCQVSDRNGKDLHETEVWKTKATAVKHAQDWIRKNVGKCRVVQFDI